jgi:hypothetical protein
MYAFRIDLDIRRHVENYGGVVDTALRRLFNCVLKSHYKLFQNPP